MGNIENGFEERAGAVKMGQKSYHNWRSTRQKIKTVMEGRVVDIASLGKAPYLCWHERIFFPGGRWVARDTLPEKGEDIRYFNLVKKIQVVDKSYLIKVATAFRPEGLFLCRASGIWVAIDNSDGNAWTEEFSSKYQAIRWLAKMFEKNDT